MDFFAMISAQAATDTPPQEPAVGGPQSPALADLPQVERERIQERYQDLLQVKTGSRIGDPDGDRASGRLSVNYDPERTTLMERYERKHLELTARHIPHSSVPTLRRQQRTVESGGMEALIHGNRRLIGRRLEGVSGRVLAVVTEVLQQEPDRAKISDRALVDKARAALLRAGVEDEPTRYKLGAIVSELSRDLDLHLEAKARERVAMKPDVTYGRRQVSRPGEIVQVDGTDTTIHVWDPRLGWAKATILSAIDVFTRCIVALRVVLGKPTSRDVAMLVCDMGRPVVTRSGWPYELVHHHGMPRLLSIVKDITEPSESRTGGQGPELIGPKPTVWPSVIVMDHGKEFDSPHLMSVCARAGIDVERFS